MGSNAIRMIVAEASPAGTQIVESHRLSGQNPASFHYFFWNHF